MSTYKIENDAVLTAIRSNNAKEIKAGLEAAKKLQANWNAHRVRILKSDSSSKSVMLKSTLLVMRTNLERIERFRARLDRLQGGVTQC